MFRGIFAQGRVVRADHQDCQFGRDAVEFPVLEPPEYVVGLIVVESQVHCPTAPIKGIPDPAPILLPPLRNGISDEQQIDRALLIAGHGARMPLNPPGCGLRGRNRGFDVVGGGECGT